MVAPKIDVDICLTSNLTHWRKIMKKLLPLIGLLALGANTLLGGLFYIAVSVLIGMLSLPFKLVF